MATFTVNTTADVVDGNYSQLSLREAVNRANSTIASDTIVFSNAFEGQTLVLSGGELSLSQDTMIDGDQNNDGIRVALDGDRFSEDGGSKHLSLVGASTDIALSELTFINGAGSIEAYNATLQINSCNFSENRSYSDGGALRAIGTSYIGITNSVFSGNEAYYGRGGAIGGSLYYDGRIVVRGSDFVGNSAAYGGGAIGLYSGSLTLESSLVSDNSNFNFDGFGSGGGIAKFGGSLLIQNSAILENEAGTRGGGILVSEADAVVADSTISSNSAGSFYGASGGGVYTSGGSLVLRNSTITSNEARTYSPYSAQGGGVARSDASTIFDFSNTIIAGNSVVGDATDGRDVFGAINLTNGHNIFGSDVLGNNSGDRENISGTMIFASVDPETGGGVISGRVVPLLNSTNSPALSGADPLAASATGQNGTSARPQPAGSLPDIGSVEITHALSTTTSARNDVITGTSAANTLNGDLGNDFLKGLGGKDTLNGGDGSDLLDGGTGNDKLNGGGGIDFATFSGATKVTFDLGSSTAKRGSETDTLTGLEGAIGSNAGDVFKGNQFNNYFQGGLGKDSFTGGSGRDLYDLNAVAESGVGTSNRDVISDFLHLTDDIDLMGIDANTGVAGNQAFHWVGTAALTGAGQLGFFTSGGTTTIIRGSIDADAASEFEIQLTGIKTLTSVDFYL